MKVRGRFASFAKNPVAQLVEDSTIVLPEADAIPLRTTGHAPFDGYFDATALSIGGSTKPFHHAEYTWTFTDPDNKTWTYATFAGTSQNTARGAIAAHIWDTPGTWGWSVSVKRNLGVAVRSGSVVVTNGFETSWAGLKTCLVSKTGMFTCPGLTGDPSTATLTTYDQVVAKFNEIADMAPAGPVAILIDGTIDDGWVTTAAAVYNSGVRSSGGPCYIGKYTSAGINTGFNPRIVTTNTALTAFRYGRTGGTWQNFNRLTVRGITFDGSGLTASWGQNYGTWPDANCDHAFFYEIHLNQIGQSGFNSFQMGTKSGGSRYWKGLTIANCTQTPIVPAGGTGTTANSFGYPQASHMVIMGNQIDAGGPLFVSPARSSHNLRIQKAKGLVIQRNRFARPGNISHCLKIHSAEVLCWGGNTSVGTGAFTASATSNLGQGDYRRPFQWVQNGYGVVNDPPPIFRCVVGGTTGATEPDWNMTIGADTIDGAVTWRRVAAEDVAPDVINFSDDGMGFKSHKIIVSENEFLGANSPQMSGFGPQDNDSAEYVEDIIIERNYYDGVTNDNDTSQKVIMMWATKASIRNNIFNMIGTNAGQGIIDCELRSYFGPGTEGGTYPCNDVEVYGNTAFVDSPRGTDGVRFIRPGTYGRNVKCWNNILYVPSSYAQTKEFNIGTGPVAEPFVQSNNLVFMGPALDLFVGPFTGPTGFALAALSAAKAIGLDGLPLYTDVGGNARTAPQSAGAYH